MLFENFHVKSNELHVEHHMTGIHSLSCGEKSILGKMNVLLDYMHNMYMHMLLSIIYIQLLS